ncbi:MAG: OmpA family protein [Alsobacter sp.]
MIQPSRWWPGLIPLAGLWLAAGYSATGRVETDLSGRSTAALSGQPISDLKVSISGRDAVVAGAVYTEAGRKAALETVAAQRGVRLVRDTTTLVPEVHPYAWSATRTGGTLTLAGHAPKPALRTLMLQLADASRGSATVVDSTTPAIGAPAAWDAGVTAALAAVGRLSDGKATLSDATLSLSGVSATPAAHAELLSLWTRLPSGIERGSFAVTPPVLAPYGWSASRAGAVTTLTGAVPSPELRAGQLLAAGRGAIDQTRFGAGEPPFYAAAASHALAVLSKLPTGSATLGDTGLAITGEAGDRATYDAAMAEAARRPAGLAGSTVIQPPIMVPFIWSAQATGGSLALTGGVPSDADRAALLASARQALPGVVLRDGQLAARGAPQGFAAAATSVLAQVGRLKDGKASITDGTVTVSGEAPDAAAREAVAKALAGLPEGFRVANLEIGVAAAPFRALKDAAAGTLVLSGAVPDEATRTAMLAAAKRRFFAETVADTTVVDARVPASAGPALVAALGPLSRLRSGLLTVSDGSATLKGEAFYEQAAAAIRTAELPGGVRFDTVAVNVGPPEPTIDGPGCQALFLGLLSRGTILFDSGKASIDQDSASILDALAAAASRCGGSEIEIAGHTDSTGGADANMDLSLRRAVAVVEYLAGAGLKRERLEPKGYGETRPRASNDTEDGKAANRRIEFTVK